MRSLIPHVTVTELDDAELAGLYRYPEGRRWIRANFISTVDGAAQGLDRRSGSISGAADRRVLALLRALCDVILVGATTARIEQYAPADIRPAFAPLRAQLGLPPTPPIAVITHSLNISEKLLDDPRTLVLTSATAHAERRHLLADHVDVEVVGSERVEMPRAIDALTARGHRRILTEGGPSVFAALVGAHLVDELCLTLSPQLVAGHGLRVTDGSALPEPMQLRLASLLEEEGFLFYRWLMG
ncbi:pyrimidine reductase family protein [Actinopolymorpha alba]|uniref:pyrimidine reductase family protein n=1 Tax=Actinopolymorpha alba TaxID=533267 RepID=UPI0003622F19|nr:pyrimidine reductase family protein [Actinopolymorpha alba]